MLVSLPWSSLVVSFICGCNLFLFMLDFYCGEFIDCVINFDFRLQKTFPQIICEAIHHQRQLRQNIRCNVEGNIFRNFYINFLSISSFFFFYLYKRKVTYTKHTATIIAWNVPHCIKICVPCATHEQTLARGDLIRDLRQEWLDLA